MTLGPERASLLARFLHALAVAGVALITHYVTRDAVIVSGAVLATSGLMGELLGRAIKPAVRRRRPKTTMLSELELVRALLEQLDRLHVSMDDEIDQGVKILAIMRGELQLVFMTWRGRLQRYYEYLEARGK